MTARDDAYCRWLSRFFYAPGHEPDDLAQEARLAMLRAPHTKRVAARRQVLDVVKVANRRAFYSWEYPEQRAPDLDDRLNARESLRLILSEPQTENERVAVGRTLRGEPIRRHEKALQVALGRVRARLAA